MPGMGTCSRVLTLSSPVPRLRLVPSGCTHNVTRQDVCVDMATYSRIEQGHSSPLLETLIRIAMAIGVPLTDLVRE